MKKAFLLVFIISALGYTSASAETLTWRIRSNSPYTVELSFYSQSRNHAWPGGNQVWIISDWQVHTYRLSCWRGEKICYGAWLRGNTTRYWGAGYNGDYGCSSCCYYCRGGLTKILVLQP